MILCNIVACIVPGLPQYLLAKSDTIAPMPSRLLWTRYKTHGIHALTSFAQNSKMQDTLSSCPKTEKQYG
jgi:hypothetical protein